MAKTDTLLSDNLKLHWKIAYKLLEGGYVRSVSVTSFALKQICKRFETNSQ